MMMMMMMMKEEGFDRERRSYCGCWIPRTHKNEEYCIYMLFGGGDKQSLFCGERESGNHGYMMARKNYG